MTTFEEFGLKLDHLHRRLLSPEAQRRIAAGVAIAAKKDVAAEVKRDLGGDMSMSGFRYRGGTRKPIVFRSGFEHVSPGVVRLTPRPAAPWIVLEDGRRATTAPKASGARRKRRTSTLATPWGPRSYTSTNPLRIGPTSGKGTFKRSADVIRRETPRRVQVEVQKALREVF